MNPILPLKKKSSLKRTSCIFPESEKKESAGVSEKTSISFGPICEDGEDGEDAGIVSRNSTLGVSDKSVCTTETSTTSSGAGCEDDGSGSSRTSNSTTLPERGLLPEKSAHSLRFGDVTVREYERKIDVGVDVGGGMGGASGWGTSG